MSDDERARSFLIDLAEATHRQTALLATISQQLDQLTRVSAATQSPNYRRYLSEFSRFDWGSIGAEIVGVDGDGVLEVEWFGHRFNRRSGEKFNERFFIFSRPGGGEGQYITLIKFVGDTPPGMAQAASQPATIDPLDIQRTQAKPEPRRQQERKPVAAPITNDARTAFYKLGGDAVASGKLAVEKFNSLVTRANKESYAAALQGLQAVIG